ncbi:MAG: DUF1573 domain-containing protein [Pirellulales bacterium]
MLRSACALVVTLCAATASAQQWADKMFSEKSVDFGAVPRAAKVEHEFVITNLYKEDVHIAGVRSSCGCTEPRIESDTLKSWGKGRIVAAFNTDAFTGQRGATVTVTFDRPQWAEVQLRVKGYIRTDVVLNPGQVNFGSVPEGEASEKAIHIRYAGRDDWKITGVTSDSPFLTATVKEAERSGGQVGYELDVKLAEGAPAGYLNEQLVLKTNGRHSQFPVKVEGRIVPPLTVSPASLLLGTLQPGQKVKKQIVVKGAKPFKIVDIRCEDGAFQFKTSDETKAVHLVPLVFEAPEKPGSFACTIEIVTDLNGHKSVTLSAIGQTSAPLAAR